MRVKSASTTAIVLVVICLLMSLGRGTYGILLRLESIRQGMDASFLPISILYIAAAVAQAVAMLIIFGVLCGARERLLCAYPDPSCTDDLTCQPQDACRIRLRNTAATAVVLVFTSMAIGILSNLIYVVRMLPYIGRGQPTFFMFSTVVGLVGGVLLCTAVAMVFKSLGRTQERLMRDMPDDAMSIDTSSGGSAKIRVAAVIAFVMLGASLGMSLTVAVMQYMYTMKMSQGHVDVFSTMTMILGFVGGVLLDVSLLMVMGALMRIKEPDVYGEPSL